MSATTTTSTQNWARKAREASDASGSVSASSQASDTSPVQRLKPLKASPARTKTRPDGKVARKKVAKACLACQKSHLTCDECRPCTRCTKKGIGDQCVEGVRKKAKYLMEGDERAAPAVPAPVPTAPTATATTTSTAPPAPVPAPAFNTSPTTVPFGGGTIPVSMLGNVSVPAAEPVRVPDNIWLTAPLPEVQPAPVQLTDWAIPANDPFNFSASAAANLEYEMFDSMFGSMSPSFPLGDLGTGNTTDGSTPSLWSNFGLPDPSSNNIGNDNNGGGVLLTPQADPPSSLQPMLATDQSPSNPLYTNGNNWSQGGVFDDNNPLGGGLTGGIDLVPILPKKLTPSDVYNNVVKPYDYTEGYHSLMEYLTQTFDKPDILRVVRALAAFRPSLIALQMPMTEEDEIFVERSFQRTLIELEKLISYSATPTAVWRRTGEIVAAAPEFCKLIGKTEEELVRARTCIYQLMAKQSTIDYWENFAVHAFENTTQNFFQATTLVNGAKSTPCAACYTIRRDVFDLPSVVIGQFLPIPAEALNGGGSANSNSE
ncbi:Transcriptional regulator of nonfermentable carbon utilization [Vanrija albida]|uniref:Transcription activator of gluconeogenesis ERT1 n=1 Tax=Vanrija albida TaxID=181172 RepID=A0ABR3PVA9_9TREE